MAGDFYAMILAKQARFFLKVAILSSQILKK